jgi:hypothetical protein
MLTPTHGEAKDKAVKALHRLVQSIPKERRGHWTVHGDRIRVLVGRAQRFQDVRVKREGSVYDFTSVVLGTHAVTRSRKRWRIIAEHAWRRNADLQLVGFQFDERDRLIGRISHPADHLDPDELELYVNALARECDAFEYVLSGEDQH